MEVSAFAEQVLVGRTLADKLLVPAALTDVAPRWSGVLPTAPGRVPELAIGRGKGPRTPLQVPDDARERGALLHAFANHELLAIELLARALLAYPDAPSAFRRGLVQTLQEEQRHLALYLDRMRALGVRLGEWPLSGFFWRAMAGLQTPKDFVAHLSLTFEQANLDFALHYQRAFAELGDHETAAVLQTVLDDEIGHVALGLRWFERWRDPDLSLFEAHRDALRPPLQVVRAKAATFDVSARRQAGLPEAYIESLRAAGGSRGRPARVWWFNGAAEHEVEHGMRYTPPASTLATVRDLETVPMFLAGATDVVLVSRRPRPAFLARLSEGGFVLPRFEEAQLQRSPWPAPKGLGALSDLCPWGRSPRADAFAATARVRASGDAATWRETMRALYDKRTAVRLATQVPADPCWSDPALGARVASSAVELEAARRAFETLGHATRVKPTFGASGRGQLVLRSAEDLPSAWAMLERSGAVVLEPQFDVVAQFSIRMRVDDDGARVEGVGRCGSTGRGQFDYAVVGSPDAGLCGETRRWLRGEGRDPKRLDRMADAVAAVVGPEAARAGVRGPLGVDALLVRTREGLRLRPLVDLNPRYTMGFVAAALAKRCSTRARGVLRVTTRADLDALGRDDFEAWASTLPSPRFEDRGSGRRLAAGVVLLTDPTRARSMVLSLSVAPSVDEALALVR